MEYVHFIRPKGKSGPVTIGASPDPRQMLAILQAGNPDPLELMGAVDARLYPEQVMWHKGSIKTTSIKIIPMWKALKMLDGSLVRMRPGSRRVGDLVGVPRHPSTQDWSQGGKPVRSDKPYPVARVDV